MHTRQLIKVLQNRYMLKYEKLKHIYQNIKTENKIVKFKIIRKDQLTPVQDQTPTDWYYLLVL